jgi:hypothetical protein
MKVSVVDNLELDGNEFCVNLIDLPDMGDVIRAADGAPVVVDAVADASA